MPEVANENRAFAAHLKKAFVSVNWLVPAHLSLNFTNNNINFRAK